MLKRRPHRVLDSRAFLHACGINSARLKRQSTVTDKDDAQHDSNTKSCEPGGKDEDACCNEPHAIAIQRVRLQIVPKLHNTRMQTLLMSNPRVSTKHAEDVIEGSTRYAAKHIGQSAAFAGDTNIGIHCPTGADAAGRCQDTGVGKDVGSAVSTGADAGAVAMDTNMKANIAAAVTTTNVETAANAAADAAARVVMVAAEVVRAVNVTSGGVVAVVCMACDGTSVTNVAAAVAAAVTAVGVVPVANDKTRTMTTTAGSSAAKTSKVEDGTSKTSPSAAAANTAAAAAEAEVLAGVAARVVSMTTITVTGGSETGTRQVAAGSSAAMTSTVEAGPSTTTTTTNRTGAGGASGAAVRAVVVRVVDGPKASNASGDAVTSVAWSNTIANTVPASVD